MRIDKIRDSKIKKHEIQDEQYPNTLRHDNAINASFATPIFIYNVYIYIFFYT